MRNPPALSLSRLCVAGSSGRIHGFFGRRAARGCRCGCGGLGVEHGSSSEEGKRGGEGEAAEARACGCAWERRDYC